MMTNFFIYCGVLLFILLLPDRIWEKKWHYLQISFTFLMKGKNINPLQREQKRGEALLAFLPNLEAKLTMGLKTTNESIPQYKFYTSLLLDLIGFHQKRGISLKTILPELRLNLTKDLQFESRLQSNMLGGNFQFLAITITTWSFIFFSSIMAELPLNIAHLSVILIIQLLGGVAFNLVLRKLKIKTFSKFSMAIERLYLFIGLVEVGMPMSQTLSESRVLEGEFMQNESFSPCASRLVTLVDRWKENGISPKTEASEIIREIWHLKEVSFERFLKHLDALKFIILAFFFLPAYFFYLYSIFQFFMEQ